MNGIKLTEVSTRSYFAEWKSVIVTREDVISLEGIKKLVKRLLFEDATITEIRLYDPFTSVFTYITREDKKWM